MFFEQSPDWEEIYFPSCTYECGQKVTLSIGVHSSHHRIEEKVHRAASTVFISTVP